MSLGEREGMFIFMKLTKLRISLMNTMSWTLHNLWKVLGKDEIVCG
jgi:hypothetical protein